jgi:hypothetical protein
VTQNGSALTVTATQVAVNSSTSKLTKGEYLALISITAGSVTRSVTVHFIIFPNVLVALDPPSTMSFPANGSFADQTIKANAFNNDGTQNPNGITVTPSILPYTPESAAVSITTISSKASDQQEASFTVHVDSKSSALSPGDNDVLIAFKNGNSTDPVLGQVYLDVKITLPIPQTVTVSGTVSLPNSQPISGALVQFTGGVSVSTNSSGQYSATLPAGYSGTETVSLSGYSFRPASYTISNLTSSLTGQNFTGTVAIYSISGSITTAQGYALPNVQIVFSGAQSAFTSATGYYSATLPAGYSGTATPKLGGYSFTPASRTYTNLSADAPTENYTGATGPPQTGSAQLGVYRNGLWFVDWNGNRAWDSDVDGAHVLAFGLPGDQPVIGDWNGDGRLKLGVYRNGYWFVDWNGNGVWDGTDAANVFQFGLPGDQPVMGDWNGDGRLKPGVFRNGYWFVDWNGNRAWDDTDAAHVSAFGLAGDLPVMGDWNGDGRLKMGVYRNGYWFVDWNGNGMWDSTDAAHVMAFGLPGDLPVMGDWNGDGKLKIGVYRNGFWFVDWNGNGMWDSTDAANVFAFGLAGDLPVMANWSNAAGQAMVDSPVSLLSAASPHQWRDSIQGPELQRRLADAQNAMAAAAGNFELQTELHRMQTSMEQLREQLEVQ